MRYIQAFLFFAAVLCLPVHPDAKDVIADGGFDKRADRFWATGGVVLSRQQGRLCAHVDAGGEPWSRLIGVNDLVFRPGQSYRLAIAIEATGPRSISVSVQRAVEPWPAQAEATLETKSGPTRFSTVFRATEAEPAQLVFRVGGGSASWSFCLDDVTISPAEPEESMPRRKTAAPALPALVNQAGYFSDGPKRATVLSDAGQPLPFKLKNAAGIVVGEGMTAPGGFDASAGAQTQVADFSAFVTPGEGYRLEVDGRQSHPFSIGDDIYSKLRVDALSWFYPQRSGIEIRGAIAGKAYARPAGHVGKSPNGGDAAVSCLTGEVAAKLYGSDWTCTDALDATGGWYDAGDQGKYVVTGAVAAAQLLGAYERGLVYGGGRSPVLADGLACIPESGNGMPDILDEARYELDFLLKMVVPDGQPLAGMAYHKLHDTQWTGLPMLPHLDPQMRALHRPSTAATLDLAAAAAQGSRLFAPYDAAFAKRLLSAARKAWIAAAANPVLLAPQSDGQQGGGDYDDDDIADEAYWAATELYLTTGDAPYLAALKTSSHWKRPVFAPSGAFDWRNVAALAHLDLALFGDRLADDDKAKIRSSVVAAARAFRDIQKSDAFGHLYRPVDNRYDWGSNQLTLQNMIVVSAAYDLTGERDFLDGVREGMDYLLGRNALNQSYITGYGSVSSNNQHSRWYAHQLDATLPHPPAGSLAGGPNSTLVDDVAKARLKGCAPQRCYIDDIMAWGTNEIAINWNAPLVYVASFLADAR